MNYVNQFLNFVSDGLLLPAVTLEIILLFWAVWALGAFARESWQRMRAAADVRAFVAGLGPGTIDAGRDRVARLPPGGFRDVATAMLDGRPDRRVARYRISGFEASCQRELDRARLMTRMGPMLGLMGTLIPKGHALGQLALGDVSAMTQNLQVAFANTVVGLFIGLLGFVIYQGRQRWFNQEIDTLDYLHDLLFEEDGHAR